MGGEETSVEGSPMSVWVEEQRQVPTAEDQDVPHRVEGGLTSRERRTHRTRLKLEAAVRIEQVWGPLF